jgi:hypothetical protein
MLSPDSFHISKKLVRLICDGLALAALGTAAILMKFVVPVAATTNPGARPATSSLSVWWLLVPVGMAFASQLCSRLITYSLEKDKPALDWSICGVLHQFHLRAFGTRAGCRVTLLQVDHNGEELIPTHRYSAGKGPEYVERGRTFSTARFRPGRAIVGFSWERHEDLISTTVPDHIGYDNWAKTELNMTDKELRILSDRNRRQKYFASWGFLDSHGRLLGAIAVDCEEPEPYRDPENPAAIFQDTAAQLQFLLTT